MATFTKFDDSEMLTAKKLHPQAAGRWLDIFQYVCPGMFDDAIRNLGSHVTCPLHGGEEDFRFIKKARNGKDDTATSGAAMCSCGKYPDGFAVLHRAMGGRFIDVLRAVDEYLNGHADSRPKPVKAPVFAPKADDPEEAKKLLASAKRLWSMGKTLDLEQYPYYIRRGIDPRALVGLQNVRSTEKLAYYVKSTTEKTKTGGDKYVKADTYPALLARMQNADGDLVAVHRTWLSKDRCGKAPVSKAKKLSVTPGCAGAAIRLFEAKGSDILGITEGIETGLAARQLSIGGYFPELGHVPVWACYSERNVRNFVVPPELLSTLRTIVVFADNDAKGVGLAAAIEFKQRMAVEHPDIEVIIKVPPVTGYDWLDVLVNL